MRVLEQFVDLQVQRKALARMAEIDLALLEKGEDVDALLAERAGLDGSWVGQQWIEVEGVLTEDQAAECDRAAAAAEEIAASNAAIKAELDANDVRAIRAMLEGDTERLAAHAKRQAELRAKLR